MEGAAQQAGDVWKIVSYTLAGVVGALSLALVKVAKIAWQERMGRVTDRDETIAQMRVMKEAMKEKRGGSQ